MTLSLLLDENISPEVARRIAENRPDITIDSVYFWRDGQFQGVDGEVILIAAAKEGVTLVTYDQKTILPVLVRCGQAQTSHAGVIFIDHRTIASNNFGALVRSLIRHFDACSLELWTDRVDFLRAAT